MSDTVLIYVTDPTPSSAALRVTLRGAHQSSGVHLLIVSSAAITEPGGARFIRTRDDLDQLGAQLSKSDSLFASAWFSRSRDKDRKGDGESWDKKGFDCP